MISIIWVSGLQYSRLLLSIRLLNVLKVSRVTAILISVQWWRQSQVFLTWRVIYKALMRIQAISDFLKRNILSPRFRADLSIDTP